MNNINNYNNENNNNNNNNNNNDGIYDGDKSFCSSTEASLLVGTAVSFVQRFSLLFFSLSSLSLFSFLSPFSLFFSSLFPYPSTHKPSDKK